MPIPFQASSWKFRASHGLPAIHGSISGTVSSAIGGSLHPASGVVQVFGQVAHDPESFFNAARVSHDEGKTWTTSYLGVEGSWQTNEVVASAWSLDTSGGTYHYQFRYHFAHSFFVADGFLDKGYARIYISQDGVNFSILQDLYTWNAVNAVPGNSGGQAAINAMGCTNPVKIAGSGPNGEDAWWLAANAGFTAGGTSNGVVRADAGLWYSLDGFTWNLGQDLSAVPQFSGAASFGGMFVSSTGRVFISSSGALTHTDDGGDLFNATWSVIAAQYNVPVPMYGGTLLTARNGSFISEGFAAVSCDDGGSFTNLFTPTVPANNPAYILKLGPAEAILITSNSGTDTMTYYSVDGGETWVGGEVWLSSATAERVAFAALMDDGRPLVLTGASVFFSNDTAQGVLGTRTVCPLANAGLAAARPLLVCGLPISNICEPQ